ncbi:MAG: hypothetical protein M1838_004065 [Thelocarpon superellum]|nr:MAG: hypothetical protein M1838_004065 [Thelocarpon superellum]
MKELTEYLRRDPSPLASPSGFSNATIRALFGAMQPYNLTKAEMLMLLNLRPQSIPVLDAIIEEMEARFTNEEQERILAVVEEILDRGPDQDVASAATQFVGQMRQDRASRMNETNA